jgi:hypothetical protein
VQQCKLTVNPNVTFVHTVIVISIINLIVTIDTVILWPCHHLYHFRFYHSSLRRSMTAPKELHQSQPGRGHIWGLHPLGTAPSNAPTPSPNREFLFNPWDFTT